MKKLKKALLIILLLAAGVLAAVLAVIPALRYKQAVKLAEEKQYAEALEVFSALDGYRDSDERTAQAYAELERELTECMARSLSEAEAAIRAFPAELDSETIAGYRELCGKYLPYCGSFVWNTDELKGDRSFASDFSLADGQLFWLYSGAELNALDFAIGSLKVQDHAFFAVPTPVEDMTASESWLEVITAKVSFADGGIAYDYGLSLLGNLGESLIHYAAEKTA